ncbi:MAG: site-specific integrase [Nitrospira sp.]
MREWEWCQQNPVSRVSSEKENNKRDRWLNSDEEGRLLTACAPWLQDVVTLALNTGLRMGKILELTWRAVDFNRRTVTVFRSQNGERRTSPVNQAVLTVLKNKAKVRSLATDRVFCSKAFTPTESGHLPRAFRLALSKAMIEDFHFHDVRHIFATTLVQSGIDLYKVRQLLGHNRPL